MCKEKMIKCNRCGLCCYFVVDSVRHKCKYLVKLPNKTTLCRQYNNPNRIGMEIHKGIYCNKIENIPEKFKDCPYNVLKE